MKRLIAGILAVGLVAVVMAAPAPAEAYWRGGGGGSGNFWGGFAAGSVTGLVVGGLFAPRFYAAPPVVYQPAPVYVQPAPVYAPVYVQPVPVCSDYWVNQYWNGYGWVPGYWARSCR